MCYNEKMKGSISMTTGVAIASATFIASIIGGFWSAQIGTNEKINTVQASILVGVSQNKQDIAVANNSYVNLEKKVDTLGDDIKELLRLAQ